MGERDRSREKWTSGLLLNPYASTRQLKLIQPPLGIKGVSLPIGESIRRLPAPIGTIAVGVDDGLIKTNRLLPFADLHDEDL